jgi:hypothetical protein
MIEKKPSWGVAPGYGEQWPSAKVNLDNMVVSEAKPVACWRHSSLASLRSLPGSHGYRPWVYDVPRRQVTGSAIPAGPVPADLGLRTTRTVWCVRGSPSGLPRRNQV